jgi:hypothetical protein
MYTLNRDHFRKTDTKRVLAFVECWERYYSGNDPEYCSALNLGHDLTKQHVTRLLRWKDPRFLTHPTADGSPNPRVQRVLKHIGLINDSRIGRVNADEFETVTRSIFPNGIVWQIFLFHIARPLDWPIADQNVFRSYAKLFNVSPPDSFETYRPYSETFRKLAIPLRRTLGRDRYNLERAVLSNKRLDNALVSFGQFLAEYDR